ncbi:hypothetical protein TNCT_320081 [Trichonephila clavata]|uniref:Uncharacterized protein n=1 Tax=Trichonephila clavata TaxID=2740835 RepID=A0A8X6L0W7_TRICU|nr:hypothetical protein TNCT_320081 [Trichonephila clavata]
MNQRYWLSPICPESPWRQPSTHGSGSGSQAHHSAMETFGSLDHVVRRLRHGYSRWVPVYKHLPVEGFRNYMPKQDFNSVLFNF